MDQIAPHSVEQFSQQCAAASSLEFALLATLIGAVCLLALLAMCKH